MHAPGLKIAGAAIPRGGVIMVTVEGEDAATCVSVSATGTYARLSHGVPALLAGRPETDSVDAHGIQAYYTGLVARACGMDLSVATTAEGIDLRAVPAARAEASA